MKNLILLSILSLVLLSSCGTLENTTAEQAYQYRGYSNVNDNDEFWEEDYWLMGHDIYSLEFRDPFGFMNQYKRNWRQKFFNNDNQ